MNPIDVHVGKTLRDKRSNMHMGVGDVVQALGIDQEVLEHMENGLQRVSAAQLFAFCRLYSITPASIYEGLAQGQRPEVDTCEPIDDAT